MSGFPGTDVRERVIRWLEDGQGELGAILGILHDYERLHGVVQAAESQVIAVAVDHIRGQRERRAG